MNIQELTETKMITVISRADLFEHEAEWLTRLFDAGMERFHLRKPDASEREVEELLNNIPKKYHSKTVLHYNADLAQKYSLGGVHLSGSQSMDVIPENFSGSVSKSCHRFDEIEKFDELVDYIFLSPVKNSISKVGYESSWTDNELRSFLLKPRKSKVIALGGIDSNNAAAVLSLGFDGVAVLGALWNADDQDTVVKNLIEIENTCQKADHIR